MPTLFLEVGNYTPLIPEFVLESEHGQTSEKSMIDSGGCFVLICVFSGSIFKFGSFQKYHLKIDIQAHLQKKKLKSLANKKSYNFPNFKSLMNHDDRTTRLLHGLHTKVHRTGDFLTYTRAVITKPGAVT